jgi:hypothetical protein
MPTVKTVADLKRALTIGTRIMVRSHWNPRNRRNLNTRGVIIDNRSNGVTVGLMLRVPGDVGYVTIEWPKASEFTGGENLFSIERRAVIVKQSHYEEYVFGEHSSLLPRSGETS